MEDQQDVFLLREKKEWDKRKEGADMKKNSSGFLGGIHPADGSDKELTVQAAVTEVNPDIVEISMEQTPGNVCRLLVKEGAVSYTHLGGTGGGHYGPGSRGSDPDGGFRQMCRNL